MVQGQLSGSRSGLSPMNNTKTRKKGVSHVCYMFLVKKGAEHAMGYVKSYR